MAAVLVWVVSGVGCRHDYLSRSAGANEYDWEANSAIAAPLKKIDQSLALLLARQSGVGIDPNSGEFIRRWVAFGGIESSGLKNLGDFEDRLAAQLEASIASSGGFRAIGATRVERGLQTAHTKRTDLADSTKLREFASAMEQSGQPMDYFLFARLAVNPDERYPEVPEYRLTLELVEVATGQSDTETVMVRP